MNYREHNELAKAQVHTRLTELRDDVDELIGWMGTAGYDVRDLSRAHEAQANVRALYDTIVRVQLEAERGRVVAL